METRGCGQIRRRVSAREKGETQGMADDPVWPDPFRPRIVAPAKGKKSVSRGEPHDVLATHESRYHADYLQEIFNPFALNEALSPNIFAHKYTSFRVVKNVRRDGFEDIQF